MGIIRLLAAPIRKIVRFPLFQLAFVVAVILLLQGADDNSTFGQIFKGLVKLVDATVRLFSELFDVKSFTRSGLTAGLMIGYVYLACLLILSVMRLGTRALVAMRSACETRSRGSAALSARLGHRMEGIVAEAL